jgi:thiol-disulfide isomerase/thioredoxin
MAVVLAALAAVLITAAGDDDGGGTARDGSTAAEFDVAEAIVDGSPLAAMPDGGDDPAVGQPAPLVEGQGRDGAQLTAPAPGRPTVLLFLAHWCPHCQEEVPAVQGWVDDGRVPGTVDLVAVSTAVTSDRPNYPPSAWLDREGWSVPTIADATGVAAEAYGLTAFPFWVVVDAEGQVVERLTGEVSEARFDALAAAAAS